VIRHAMNAEELLSTFGDDAGDVFVEFFFVRLGDQVLSAFDRKDYLYVELRIGIGHLFAIVLRYNGRAIQKMRA